MTDITSTTRLGAAVIPETNECLSENNVSSYRAVSDQATTADILGPLKDLPGYWQGEGFNLIARPDFDSANEDGFFLELNWMRETVQFTSIGSPVYNRGSKQDDIALFGVTYLQRVSDANTGGALHIEPGVWLRIPATTAPPADESVARLGTIPHGNSVCCVGFVEDVVNPGPIEIPPLSTAPYEVGAQPPAPGTKNPFKAYDLSQDTPFRTSPIGRQITQELIDDPHVFIRAGLDGHEVKHVTRLITSTSNAGGIGNIPFVTENANAVNMDSLWAVEHIAGPGGTEFLQLQYTQVALLNFRGMIFPHINVATLIKTF